jgi:hypothetical protein
MDWMWVPVVDQCFFYGLVMSMGAISESKLLCVEIMDVVHILYDGRCREVIFQVVMSVGGLVFLTSMGQFRKR